MDGAHLPVIDITALANMTARLKVGQIARHGVGEGEIPAVILDAGVRTDHALSDIAPPMAFRAAAVWLPGTPEQAIAAYTMQAVDGVLSK